MRFFWLCLALLSYAEVVLGVKEYLFKSCESAGFCHRNKFFSANVEKARNFMSPYAIDEQSLVVSEEGPLRIFGVVEKSLEKVADKVRLPFELSFLDNGKFRFKVDEDRSHVAAGKFVNKQRYNEADKWSFKTLDLDYESSAAAQVRRNKNGISVAVDTYAVQLNYNPISIEVRVGAKLVLAVNSDNFLNIEHLRPKDSNELHLSQYESDYDMFHDSFPDNKDDRLPLGPESIGLDLKFVDFKNVYGIPEHANSMNLKDTSDSKLYRLFNIDIFEYETHSNMPMYGSIPFMMASKPGLSVGVFWNNAADTFIDVRKTQHVRTHWISENGIIDLVVMVGDTPSAINQKFGEITGYTALPQLFALGYHQCRWNYNDEKDVLMVSQRMDESRIPMDTIWLDIEYTDSKKYFTWSEDNFPDPERLLNRLDDVSRNLVIIIDPHLKVGYHISEAVEKKKISINNADNSSYHGHCWPGESVWIDSFNPNSQSFWDEQFAYSEDNKFMGKLKTNMHIWNDMNEISVFNAPETTSPRDNLHYGGWEDRSVHNLNGLSFHELTYNSLIKRLGQATRQRPFILTRSYFAGSQRTAAMWTGDNMSRWEYLKISIPMVLTNGIAGMPFAGADVGGFFGDPTKDLLARWYQTGIWYPFFRAHAHIDSRRREPYLLPEPYQSIIRDAINLRYSLLPEFYTAFYESSKNGSPILKPLFYENPDNADLYSIEDQFFLGSSGIMVKPVTDENAKAIPVTFPDAEMYYDFTNGKLTDRSLSFSKINQPVELSDIPMFIKGGSIIFRKERYRRSTGLMENDPYTLTVALSKKGTATGSLYIDDFESFDYVDGNYAYITVTADGNEISSTIEAAKYDATNKIERITILQAKTISKATIHQGSKQWDARIKIQGSNVVLENPGLRINSQWTIKLEHNPFHDEL